MEKISTEIITIFPELKIIHQKLPGYKIETHSHEHHEFIFPIQGEVVCSFSKIVLKTSFGKFLCIPPNLNHSFSSSSKGEGERIICLIPDSIWKKFKFNQTNPGVFYSNLFVKEILFYLLLHPKLRGAKYFIQALFDSLISIMDSSKLKLTISKAFENKKIDFRIQKAMKLIEANLETVYIPKIAKESDLSLRHFNRLFYKETGITPSNYLIFLRIEKAKMLIKNTDLTITDISLEVGYNSLSKFIETFKKLEGTLPSSYRNNNNLLTIKS